MDGATAIRLIIGLFYVILGVLGVVLNLTTIAMIASRRVYRLSAYTIMANVALADALMMCVIGIACGGTLLANSTTTNNVKIPNKSLVVFQHEASPLHLHKRALLNDEYFVQLSIFLLPKQFRSREFANRHKNNTNNGQHTISSEYGNLNKRNVNITKFFATSNTNNFTISDFNSNNSTSYLFTSLVSFVEIASWTAGVMSYAFLGLNRCVAICYYGTNARRLNRVWVAFISSAFTWLVGITAACIGTFPRPFVYTQSKMWTLSFVVSDENRCLIFIGILLSVYVISVTLQWACSTLVLMKIHQVKKKISRNKLNESSAIRFKKQARLTFQFFYPSLFCTISSILYFVKPFCRHLLTDSHLIALHIIWLLNHLCNPFIYAYFNDRMRTSYREFLTCARIRQALVRRRRRRNLFKRRNLSKPRQCHDYTRPCHNCHGILGNGSYRKRADPAKQANSSRSAHRRNCGRSAHHHMSTRSAGAISCKSDGNFVRNSLQLQSRDFEQLCEFMMRVNPLYDSSEGWRESSSDDDDEKINTQNEMSLVISTASFHKGRTAHETHEKSRAAHEDARKFHKYRNARQSRSSRSIVLDMGRQTVEHWAVFAKKASI